MTIRKVVRETWRVVCDTCGSTIPGEILTEKFAKDQVQNFRWKPLPDDKHMCHRCDVLKNGGD